MKGERTKEDVEHVDETTTQGKELKELAPDEARPVEKSEQKKKASKSQPPTPGQRQDQAK